MTIAEGILLVVTIANLVVSCCSLNLARREYRSRK